jgi:hypothetical protein
VKPPECVVCGADAAAPGELVRFVSRPEDLAWRRRVERDRLVGHPPDTAWLCERHVEAGRRLAPELDLDDAVSRLRASDPSAPPSPEPRVTTIRGMPIAEFVDRLQLLVTRIAAQLGVPAPDLVPRTTRTWHPMDGAVAPDCPFVDDTTWTSPESPLTLVGSRAWWSDGVLARAHETLLIRVAGVSASVSGHIPADRSTDRVGELLITGDLPSAVAALVADSFPAA